MTIETADIIKLRNNPYRGLNYVVNALEQSWFDQKVSINSGTHPVVFCADLTIGVGYGFLNSLSDAISQVFPEHARSIAELSRNMNDLEYYGLFGVPANSKVQFIVALDNLIRYAPTATSVINGVNLSYQKMLIPKDTQFDVAGYQFAIENGIEIRYNERTGVQVVYDSTTNNPFNPITTNVLTRSIKSINGTQYLIIDIPIRQLAYDFKENIPSTESSGCSGTLSYSDYLYGIRAFITGSDGIKTEMKIAYDKAVFDPGMLTMTIDLNTNNNQFEFGIPDIYIQNGLGVGTVSIYVYTTKGGVEKDFQDTELEEYVTAYRDFRYGATQLNEYSSFIPDMGGIVWRFNDVVSGGSVPRSFSQIKYQVVNGRRQRNLPITENNIIGTVEQYGYSAVKTIDFVTSRLYSLTKELPVQTNKDFYSGVNCFVGSHLISATQLVNSGVAFDNKERVTIPSGTLYDVTEQVPSLLSAAQVTALNNLSYPQLIAYMESKTLTYLPFHYVFDTTNSQATIRSYYLDNPSFGVQSFQEENTNLGIEVGVNAATITFENNGYTILVETTSGNSFKVLPDEQIGVQLSFTIAGSTQLASLKGELAYKSTDGESVYKFRLETNFDLDDSDQLHLTNLTQYGKVQPDTPVPLEDEISIYFLRSTGNWNTIIPSDDEIDRALFTIPMQTIIKTNIDLVIGKRLERIYNRIRPLVGEGQYQQYDYNVPATYDENIYQKENGELVIDEDTKLPILLHRKGEPKLTDAGNPIYQYLKGDFIKDDEGNFIPLAPRELNYHWDFVGFDGVYKLSKDDYDLEFAQKIKDYLADTITADIDQFMQLIIDQTKMVYQPKNKLSWKKVVVNSNYNSVLKQDLSFEVTYYLTKSGSNNTNLKTSLKSNTPKILNNYLYSNLTVGIAKLSKALMENLPDDVVDVKINALSGDSTVDVISTVDDLSGFSVRKTLVLGDNKLPSIQEDVKVDFLQHDSSNMD